MCAQCASNESFAFNNTSKSSTKGAKNLGMQEKQEVTESKLRKGPVLQGKMVKGINHRVIPLLKG